MPEPITTLPDHYQEVKHLVATTPKTLFWLNVASLVPLGLALLLLSRWSSIIQSLRGPYNTVFSETFHWLPGLLLVLIVTFGGHEAAHGLAIRLTGHRPRFGMKLDKGVFYATADGAYFRRNEFLMIALAPLGLLTVLGLLLMMLLPDGLAYYVGLVVALNAAGAIGDLWMSAEVLRYSPDCLVKDEADSIRIYVA